MFKNALYEMKQAQADAKAGCKYRAANARGDVSSNCLPNIDKITAPTKWASNLRYMFQLVVGSVHKKTTGGEKQNNKTKNTWWRIYRKRPPNLKLFTT